MGHAFDCEAALELWSNRRSVRACNLLDALHRLFDCIHDEAGHVVLGHSYDHAIPNGKPAGVFPFTAGPWLWPSLDFSGYDYQQGLQIVQKAIDGFRQRPDNLANDKVTLPKPMIFILAGTIGTLGPMVGQTSRIHIRKALPPSPANFLRLCGRIFQVGNRLALLRHMLRPCP